MEIENICIECGKPFITNDEEMNYCAECWAAALGLNEGMEEDTEDTDNEEGEE